MGLWNRITGAPDRNKFIADAVARIRSIIPDAKYDDANFVIRGGNHSIFLGSFWTEYQNASKSERDAVLDRIVDNTLDLESSAEPTSYEEVRGRLRPMVHDPIYWSASRLKVRAMDLPVESVLPTVRPFGPRLTLSIVIDMPTSMRGVTAGDRETWKRDFDALLVDAMENLVRASHTRWDNVRPGVFRLPFNDGYAVARLALPKLFRELPVRGAPVVLALNAGVVYVTGADDVGGMLALAELGREVFDLPKPMTPVPLTLAGDEWVTYEVPANHPAKSAFDLLRYEYLVGEYEAQQTSLKQLADEDGPFIATYRAMQRAGEAPRSIATLTITVESSLPKADYVIIMVPGATPADYSMLAQVPWDRFAEIIPLKAEPDLAPPRFYATGEVTEAQRDALLAANCE